MRMVLGVVTNVNQQLLLSVVEFTDTQLNRLEALMLCAHEATSVSSSLQHSHSRHSHGTKTTCTRHSIYVSISAIQSHHQNNGDLLIYFVFVSSKVWIDRRQRATRLDVGAYALYYTFHSGIPAPVKQNCKPDKLLQHQSPTHQRIAYQAGHRGALPGFEACAMQLGW